MRRNAAIVSLMLIAVLTLPFASAGQTAEPWLGTWKPNVEKSVSKAGPAPMSNTVTIETMTGGGQKHTLHGVGPNGETTHTEWVTKYDGSESRAQAVQPLTTQVRTATFKRIDDRTFEVLNKTDGKPTVTTRVAVANDGKTATSTNTGMDSQGQTINTVTILEKQ